MDEMALHCEVCGITCADVSSWGRHLQSYSHEQNAQNPSSSPADIPLPPPPGSQRRSRNPSDERSIISREEEAAKSQNMETAVEASRDAESVAFTQLMQWKRAHTMNAGANRPPASTMSDATCKPVNVGNAEGMNVETENANITLDTNASWTNVVSAPSIRSDAQIPQADDPERCSLCVKIFNNSLSARAHYVSEKHKKKVMQMQAKASEQFESECKVCNKHFPSMVQAKSHFESKKHLQKVEGKPQKPPQQQEFVTECKLCNKHFPSEVQAKSHFESKKHLQRVEGKPPVPEAEECKVCMKILTTAAVAAAHYQSKAHLKNVGGVCASPPKEFTCNLCHVNCESETNYSAHNASKKHMRRVAATSDIGGGGGVDSANGTGGDQTDAASSNGREPSSVEEINAAVLKQLRCDHCGKMFTGFNCARDHVQSKKHLTKVSKQVAFPKRKPLIFVPQTTMDEVAVPWIPPVYGGNNQPRTRGGAWSRSPAAPWKQPLACGGSSQPPVLPEEVAVAWKHPSGDDMAKSLLTEIEGIIRTGAALVSPPVAAGVGTMVAPTLNTTPLTAPPPTDQQSTSQGESAYPDYVSDAVTAITALQRHSQTAAEAEDSAEPNPNNKRPVPDAGHENNPSPKREKLVFVIKKQ